MQASSTSAAKRLGWSMGYGRLHPVSALSCLKRNGEESADGTATSAASPSSWRHPVGAGPACWPAASSPSCPARTPVLDDRTPSTSQARVRLDCIWHSPTEGPLLAPSDRLNGPFHAASDCYWRFSDCHCACSPGSPVTTAEGRRRSRADSMYGHHTTGQRASACRPLPASRPSRQSAETFTAKNGRQRCAGL